MRDIWEKKEIGSYSLCALSPNTYQSWPVFTLTYVFFFFFWCLYSHAYLFYIHSLFTPNSVRKPMPQRSRASGKRKTRWITNTLSMKTVPEPNWAYIRSVIKTFPHKWFWDRNPRILNLCWTQVRNLRSKKTKDLLLCK